MRQRKKGLDVALTNISIAFTQDKSEFVATQVLPPVMDKRLETVIAFCDVNLQPDQRAIQAYLDYTQDGKQIPFSHDSWYNDYGELVLAHRLSSGAQRAMWLEGHFSGDYPLISVILDYLGDWQERKEPAYKLCEALWWDMHEGDYKCISKIT